MKSKMKLSAVREIKGSLGRYMAILAIIALGVGFFSGVRITTPTMVWNMNNWLKECSLYDYRLLSTLGWEKQDVEEISSEPDVRAAEGAYSCDLMFTDANENDEYVLKVHSLTENVNTIKLESGRMPKSPDECILDARMGGMKNSDMQGSDEIIVKDDNEPESADMLKYKRFKVVGYCYSPLYVNFERGTTSIGTGNVSGFMYVSPEAFDCEAFTEVYVRFDQDEMIYSDEYKAYIDKHEDSFENRAKEIADERYSRIRSDAEKELSDGENELEEKRSEALQKLDDAKSELDAAKVQLDQTFTQLTALSEQIAEGQAALDEQKSKLGDKAEALLADQQAELDKSKEQLDAAYAEYEAGLAEYESGVSEYEKNLSDFAKTVSDAQKEIDEGKEKLSELKEPDTYVLGRSMNIGIACFENDSDIVAQVARVFPIFFILVAALVCMTTMSRMVEEQRTQIGVFKALGYSNAAIMGRLMFYSGSAAVIGAAAGYAVGTVLFPRVIWMTYQLMYIPLEMKYMFDPKLATISAVVSLLCSVGTTWTSCRYELSETAASLMRPKAPKAGKRVFLERIPFIWNRLKFLVKVSVRNIFRYKKRFFMMILGISGCTALLLTGFGLKDSVAGFADVQYGDVFVTDADMVCDVENGGIPSEVMTALDENTAQYKLIRECSWDLVTKDKTKSITLEVPENYDNMDDFVRFRKLTGETINPPKCDEAIVSQSLEERYGIHEGDEMVLRDDKLRELHLKVVGVFENHVYNYVFVSPETFGSQLGEAVEFNGAYMNFPDGVDEFKQAAAISSCKSVKKVTVYSELRERMRKTMSSLDYVVLLVIVSAAGLAFIVIYNLTNINITERIREIATIKVLGFFRSETSAYVLRENIALTAVGTVVGLGLGLLLHRFVMDQIVVDMVTFRVRILPLSYVYSIALTFIFNFLVDLVMETKLDKINMAESLKTIE